MKWTEKWWKKLFHSNIWQSREKMKGENDYIKNNVWERSQTDIAALTLRFHVCKYHTADNKWNNYLHQHRHLKNCKSQQNSTAMSLSTFLRLREFLKTYSDSLIAVTQHSKLAAIITDNILHWWCTAGKADVLRCQRLSPTTHAEWIMIPGAPWSWHHPA